MEIILLTDVVALYFPGSGNVIYTDYLFGTTTRSDYVRRVERTDVVDYYKRTPSMRIKQNTCDTDAHFHVKVWVEERSYWKYGEFTAEPDIAHFTSYPLNYQALRQIVRQNPPYSYWSQMTHTLFHSYLALREQMNKDCLWSLVHTLLNLILQTREQQAGAYSCQIPYA